jgi:phosphatidylinositol dimannoside acyltransferase
VPRSKRPPDEGRLIQLVYYAYVAFSALARALPERLVYRLASGLGSFGARRNTSRRRNLEKNLGRVTGLTRGSPELDDVVREAYRSYARYWLETFRLVREGPEFFIERFRSIGNENIEGVRARGRGAIVVVGHLGNWDAAGAWVGATGRELVTVAEVLRPRRMFDFFADHRAKLGMTIFAAEAGVTQRLVQAVESGAVVAILGDRDLRGKGPKVEFFGERTTLPAGPASVALRANVPLLVAGVFGVVHEDGKRGWIADIGEPIELPADRTNALQELTQRVAVELEKHIRSRPEEWHVLQPIWSEDRTPQKGGEAPTAP